MASPSSVLRVTIDGEPHEFREGGSVLDALRTIGTRVPTLCHDERLTPSGTCRSCLVSVKSWAWLVTACTTPLADGMAIETDLMYQTRWP